MTGLLVLSEADIRSVLDPRALIAALADGFRAFARGEVQAPARPQVRTPDGVIMTMPAYATGSLPSVKMVSVFEDNTTRSLPTHLAIVNVFDPITGEPLAMLDGTYLTAVRTAATAMMALDTLARTDAATATIVGSGVQAEQHLRLLHTVRAISDIRIWARDSGSAERIAAIDERATVATDLKAAVRSSDVVLLTTHSVSAVIDDSWVAAGAHVSSVGFAPPGGELPTRLARTRRRPCGRVDGRARTTARRLNRPCGRHQRCTDR